MKQIFEWLREQIKEESANGFGTNGAFFSYLPTVRAEKVINEAEAKWEAVMAELENELKLADEEKERCNRENPLQFDTAKGYATGISNAIEIISGKPIKISEVE